MKTRRFIATAVVVALGVTVLPVPAWAADDQKSATTSKTPAVDLRGSADRALANVTPERAQVPAPPKAQPKTGRRNAAAGGGGGKGGGMGATMAIIGVAASIGTTYFVIKEMHKTEQQLTVNPQGGGK